MERFPLEPVGGLDRISFFEVALSKSDRNGLHKVSTQALATQRCSVFRSTL